MQRDRLSLVAILVVAGMAGLNGACASSASPGGTGGASGSGGSGGSASGGSGGASSGGSGGTASGGSGGTSSGGSGGTSSGGSGGSAGTPDASSSPDSATPADGSASPDGGGSTGSDGGGGGGTPGVFALRVTGATMQNGKLYFKKGQTHGSGDQSPAMEWDADPEAKSYAISMQDTDNKNYHWVMYDIPPGTTKLPDNMMRPQTNASVEVMGAKNTGFGGRAPYGYFGPGADCRAYNFIVYSLKVDTLPAMGANTAPSSIVNGGALSGNMYVLKKSAPVPVIGQSSGNMCP
jgi:phosphatidylethanolamine-binding protein (PEBP) family uncharacterized protein